MAREDEIKNSVAAYLTIILVVAIILAFYFLMPQQNQLPVETSVQTQEKVTTNQQAEEIAGNVSRTVEDMAASMEGIGSAFG